MFLVTAINSMIHMCHFDNSFLFTTCISNFNELPEIFNRLCGSFNNTVSFSVCNIDLLYVKTI